MAQIDIGSKIYDEEGEAVGTVRGFDQHGIVVSTYEEVEPGDLVSTDPSVVEAEDVLWRCSDCGEVGKLDEMPDSCPSCGTPKTDIYYWSEAYD